MTKPFIKARYPSTCPVCDRPIKVGVRIAKHGKTWAHPECAYHPSPPRSTSKPRERRAPVDTDLHKRISEILGPPEPYL